jgi:hypothetical protein
MTDSNRERAADVDRSTDFGPVEYFEVTNSQVNRSITSNVLFRQEQIECATAKYEKLAEFLRSMGIIAAMSSEGDDFKERPVILGGMLVAPIASSRDEWLDVMERLLPPEEGWPSAQPPWNCWVRPSSELRGSPRDRPGWVKSDIPNLPNL